MPTVSRPPSCRAGACPPALAGSRGRRAACRPSGPSPRPALPASRGRRRCPPPRSSLPIPGWPRRGRSSARPVPPCGWRWLPVPPSASAASPVPARHSAIEDRGANRPIIDAETARFLLLLPACRPRPVVRFAEIAHLLKAEFFFAIIALDVVPWQVRSTGKERSDMDAAAFAVWRAGVGLLNRTQRSLLLEDLALAEADDPIDHPAAEIAEITPQSEVAGASVVAERRANPAQSQGLLGQIGQARIASLGCPHCGGDEIRPWGKASGKPRYRCISCCKTFNPLTGTPLAGLRHMDRWNNQAQALINGETVAQAANRCKVAYTTAFRWRHRFLAALNLDKPQHLSGIVEADETFILESFKGKRSDLPRAARKRGGKAAKRGLSVEQIPIMVARDRSGATIDAVLPRLDTASITKALGGVIVRPAQLCCDGGSAIIAFARRARLTFHVLPAPGNPKPEVPELHINNVNAYHGRFKEWMRRFHGVATKNLPNYLSWRRTIEVLGAASTPAAWIRAAAGLGPYQHRTL